MVQSCQNGGFAGEWVVYAVLSTAVGLLLWRSSVAGLWISAWRRNPVLLAFILWSAVSVFWSVSPIHTIYRTCVVLFSALIASYFGVRYRGSGWLTIVAWFAAATVIVSYFLVWVFPGSAIMHTVAYAGAWRGVFAHKNFAGSLIAYGGSVLLLASLHQSRLLIRIALGFLAVLAAILTGMTQSATGMLVFLVLTGLVAACLVERRMRRRLRKHHIALLAFGLVLLATLLVLKRAELLTAIGRNPTLTGRLPLWSFVVGQVQEHNPWLGYGLWTVWRFEWFCRLAAAAAGWPNPIGDSHNGFLDVYLYLGAVGLALVLAVFGQLGWRAVSYARRDDTPGSIWVLLTLVYLILSNLTISFLFNRESFHWVLLVAALFAIPHLEVASGAGKAGAPMDKPGQVH